MKHLKRAEFSATLWGGKTSLSLSGGGLATASVLSRTCIQGEIPVVNGMDQEKQEKKSEKGRHPGEDQKMGGWGNTQEKDREE